MRRNILPVLITLLFAVGLWVAVNLAGEVTTSMRIPLTVEMPEGWAAASPLPRQIHATVRGPGWKIAQFALLGDPQCRVDAGNASSMDNSIVISQRVLQQSIAGPPQLSFSGIDPDSLHIALDEMRERTVPVVPAVRVDCRRGFEQIGPVHADPDSVRIAGGASIIQSVAAWSTRAQTLHNVSAPVRTDAPLSDSLGGLISVPRQSVTITADVQESAERAFLHVPIHVGDTNIHIVPSAVTVLVRGGVETLAAMRPSDIKATVDALAILEGGEEDARIDITTPPHTSVLRQEPRRAAWYVRSER